MSEHHKAFYTVEESEVGNLYYFAPLTHASGPFKEQRRVEAIIDIDADGCLAGVELIDRMPASPKAPPMTAPADSRISDERLDKLIEREVTANDRLAAFIELRERRAQAVAVKPLEWRKGYCDDRVSILQASNGWFYQIRTLYDATGLTQSIWLDWPTSNGTQFPSINKAKAAAQADFARRTLSALAAPPPVAGVTEEHRLSSSDVEWVVNDIAELGVKIGNQFFFCYKGRSLVYGKLDPDPTVPPTHEEDDPRTGFKADDRMRWRYVRKREFGECIHPINYEDLTKIGTVSLSDGDEWHELPAALSASPPAQAAEVTEAARDVLAERARQVDAEGWTPEHDDQHNNGELAKASACYALGSAQVTNIRGDVTDIWPWEEYWWKPTDTRCDLVKAGALILAEIERLDRQSLFAQDRGA